jgi:hypothetical protein
LAIQTRYYVEFAVYRAGSSIPNQFTGLPDGPGRTATIETSPVGPVITNNGQAPGSLSLIFINFSQNYSNPLSGLISGTLDQYFWDIRIKDVAMFNDVMAVLTIAKTSYVPMMEVFAEDELPTTSGTFSIPIIGFDISGATYLETEAIRAQRQQIRRQLTDLRQKP